MIKLALVGVLSVAVVLSGCTVDTRPRTVARFAPETGTKVVRWRMNTRRAPASGQYLLYVVIGADPRQRGAEKELVLTRQLPRGKRIGFERGEDGAVYAVAGDEQIAVEQRPHLWVMRAEPGQHDVGKTIAFVVAIVMVVGLVVAIIIAEAFDDWGDDLTFRI